MAIEIFRGKYVTAEDAHNYIDIGTIMNGCSMLTEASGKITNVAEKITTLKTVCNQDTLSVQGLSLVPTISDHEAETIDFSSYISQLSSSVAAAAERALNKKQLLLNEVAKAEEARQEALHAQREKKVD